MFSLENRAAPENMSERTGMFSPWNISCVSKTPELRTDKTSASQSASPAWQSNMAVVVVGKQPPESGIRDPGRRDPGLAVLDSQVEVDPSDPAQLKGAKRRLIQHVGLDMLYQVARLCGRCPFC